MHDVISKNEIVSDAVEAVRMFIARTCLQLDAEDFEAFLQECHPDFSYSVTAFSPDLDMGMVWMKHDRAAFEGMTRMIPQHVRVQGSFARFVVLADVASDRPGTIKVVSRLLLTHTDAEGKSSVRAVGKYRDVLSTVEGDLKLVSREVNLDTRELGPGLHIPI